MDRFRPKRMHGAGVRIARLSAGVLASLLFFTSGHALTRIYTTVNPDSLTVGDPVELRVTIVTPPGAIITPPPTEPGFGDFRVRQWTTDRQQRPDGDSLTFSYILTTFTVKPCSIPSIPFLRTIGDEVDTLATQVLPMRIISVVTSDTADIREIKALQSAGKPSLLWLWVVLGLVLVTAAIFGIRFLVRHRRKPAVAPPPKPPYEEALEALAALDGKQLLEKGLVRDYVFAASEILKRYIERRFDVAAAEFTTEEMLDWIKGSSLSRDQRECAEWFFRSSDPVKFARYIPDRETTGRFGPQVRRFLDLTRPVIAPTPQPEITEQTSQPAVSVDGTGG